MRFLAPAYALLVVAAVVVRVRFVFAAAVALAAVAAGLWAQVRSGERHVRVTRVAPTRAFVGDQPVVMLRAQNTGWWSQPIVEIRDTVPDALALQDGARTRLVTAVGRRSTETMTYHLHCRRRGYHAVGPGVAAVRDVFGLMQRWLPDMAVDHVIVYPEIVPMQALGLPARGPLPVVAHRSALVEDPARFAGVRDYLVGEEARRIEWLASARSTSLLAKLYEPAVTRDTMVCVDLTRRRYRSGPAGVELAIVAAASILHHVLTIERLEAGLYTHAHDPLAVDGRPPVVGVGAGTGHLMAQLEVLARVAGTTDEGFVDGLERTSLSLPFGATLVVVTGSVSPELERQLARLQRRGLVPTVIQADARTLWPGIAGVPVYVVGRNADLARLK